MFPKRNIFTKKNRFSYLIIVVIITAAGFYFLSPSRETVIEPQNAGIVDLPKSPLSGLPCKNAERRPLAVMISSDYVARPLSGINEADLVIELPVITGSMTRMMAIFICGEPDEIGSVRSARHDFIPLALGWDAIYAHWGGSYLALDKLSDNIIDNIDALPNPHNAFYRAGKKPAPHNGFTDIPRLANAAEKLDYRPIGEFSGYNFAPRRNNPQDGKLIIGYPGRLKVEYVYKGESGSYERWRGDEPEIDKNSGKTVEAKNVVLMRVVSRQIDGQYNDIKLDGGEAEVFLAGERIKGTWRKDGEKEPLRFYDGAGEEIVFVPGPIWIEGVEEEVEVKWEMK